MADERGYGCTKCQGYHYQCDPLFGAHIYHQSKHGVTWTRHEDHAEARHECSEEGA